MKVFYGRIDNSNRNEHWQMPLYLNEIEHGYDTLQKDKVFLDALASLSAFLFCCVSLTPLYLNERRMLYHEQNCGIICFIFCLSPF